MLNDNKLMEENEKLINEVKVDLKEIKGSYEQVANRARTTVGKDELGKEPSDKFKKKFYWQNTRQ